MALPSDHLQTLKQLADPLAQCRDPWWLLGSTAAALSGANVGQVRDIDVLVSAQDAERLMTVFGWQDMSEGGTKLYRSGRFLKPALGSVPIEIMANYELCCEGVWWPVWPKSRWEIEAGGYSVFVPSIAEQIDILKRLGRKKDWARIRALEAAEAR